MLFFGGFPSIIIEYNIPQNPVLMIKAPTLGALGKPQRHRGRKQSFQQRSNKNKMIDDREPQMAFNSEPQAA